MSSLLSWRIWAPFAFVEQSALKDLQILKIYQKRKPRSEKKRPNPLHLFEQKFCSTKRVLYICGTNEGLVSTIHIRPVIYLLVGFFLPLAAETDLH